ncbi:MAG: sulfurtransferase [Chloroflexi bacterium]|jgi:thiosulfate/3-mercaptopyruvate sulfurtransferase|nr:sulfurtransferase [Chloroflexota bacterium]
MSYQTLISVSEAAKHLGDENWVFIDVRYSLQDASWGRKEYLIDHIKGAVFASLNDDLSGEVIAGKTGRHPFPNEAAFVETLSQWGVDKHTQVVVYDAGPGVSAASRLWYMLRWAGHDDVAVLDGGFKHWQMSALPCVFGNETRTRRLFQGQFRPELLASADDVLEISVNRSHALLDARSYERFRGENETIDPLGGHIPGAACAFYNENLTEDGRFKSAAELRVRFDVLMAGKTAAQTVLYCGSGVSACHNALAMVYAGLGQPRLYVGSWSDWSGITTRPVALGE